MGADIGKRYGVIERALQDAGIQQLVMERMEKQLSHFPGYAHIFRVHLQLQAWSIENGLLTPTMKLRRARIIERYSQEIEQLYEGH